LEHHKGKKTWEKGAGGKRKKSGNITKGGDAVEKNEI